MVFGLMRRRVWLLLAPMKPPNTKVERTYTLPADLMAEREARLSPDKREETVAQALREWLLHPDEAAKAKIRASIEEAFLPENQPDPNEPEDWDIHPELWIPKTVF